MRPPRSPSDPYYPAWLYRMYRQAKIPRARARHLTVAKIAERG